MRVECRYCVYWVQQTYDTSSVSLGECHRHPPRVAYPSQGRMWPLTSYVDFCGDGECAVVPCTVQTKETIQEREL